MSTRPPNGGNSRYEAVGVGYFDAAGIPVLEGRTFRPSDGPDGPPIVVIDQATAQRFWPDRSPIGERMRMSYRGPAAAWHEVVGVVGAVRYELHSDPRPRLYIPDNRLPFDDEGTRYVVVQTEAGRAEAVVPDVRSALREMAPTVALASVRTFEELVTGSLAQTRLQTFLLSAFGAVALFLGSIGVYGLVSYTVSQRAGEMGVRMALGARPGQVLDGVLRGMLAPVLAGIGLGLLGALALGRFLHEMLFDVSPTDPKVLGFVSVLLLVVAVVSALGPGIRATRMDPVDALRSD